MDLPRLRPSVAFLSRRALRHNLARIRAEISSNDRLHRADAKILAVVKADAYGHSLQQILSELYRAGIREFAVASIEEGIEARAINSRARVLVLGGSLRWSRESLELVKKNRLEVAANDFEALEILLAQKKIPIHLKLDTGMNRLGLKPEEWASAIALLRSSKVSLAGLMTHHASFDDSVFVSQSKLFEEGIRWFFANGIRPKSIHHENSAALFSRSSSPRGILSEVTNFVRPGLSLYGYHPLGVRSSVKLEPVLELTSEIGLIKSIDPGEGVSYSHLYHAPHAHQYGVVSLGYADGLSKIYGQHLEPELRSKKGKRKGSLKICGAVCMDMVMVRARMGKIEMNDQIVFWGRFPNALLKARAVEPYELNLRIAKRIPRVWID